MDEYIDKSALYEKFAQLEELARNRYLETPSSSPGCSRYMTQLNERTAYKHIIADFPAADVAPVRHGRWIDKGEYAVCTECGGRSGTQYDGVELIPLMTQFCPNCGCRMDGGAY